MKQKLGLFLAVCLCFSIVGCAPAKGEMSSSATNPTNGTTEQMTNQTTITQSTDRDSSASSGVSQTGGQNATTASSSGNVQPSAQTNKGQTSKTNGSVSTAKGTTVTTKVVSTHATVHFINVCKLPLNAANATKTQADCIFISVDGTNILVDGGEDAPIWTDEIISYLKAQGVKKLDYVFLSHAHSDHAGGLAKIIDSFELGEAYTKKPDFSKLAAVETGWRTEYYYNQFVAAVARKKDASGKAKSVHQITTEAQKITLTDQAYMVVFGNTLVEQQKQNEDYNLLSLSFLFVHRDVRMYLAGDTGDPADALIAGKLGKCAVVKLAHHGSGGPYNSAAMLNQTKPTYAIYTTWIENAHDLNNYYLQTVQRLDAMGVKGYTLGMNGTLVFDSDGKAAVLRNRSSKKELHVA